MWIFTEVADWFDAQRVANNKLLDQTFQGWVDYGVKHSDDPGFTPALHNVAIYTGAGLLYALNQLTTSVASGFVDTLRIGDGVRKGGWGYGQDALRLISVVGTAARPLNGILKVGRLGLAKVVSVDPAPNAPICTWVAAARALRLSGVRHFATVQQVENALEWPLMASKLEVPVFLGTLSRSLRALGANVEAAGPLNGPVEETLLATLKANPNTVMPFSVVWSLGENAGGEFANVGIDELVGHTMLAFRDTATGALRILDRTGEIVRSLAELDRPGAYPGIALARFYEALEDTAILVLEATIVPLLQTGQALSTLIVSSATPMRAPDGTLWLDPSWVRQAIGLEVRSVPFRPEARRVMTVPVRVASAKGRVQVQTFCVPTLQNSDAPPDAPTQDCSVLRTYVVQAGDTFEAIAQLVYGDPGRWRGLAGLNGIKNPDVLAPGQILVIP